MNMDGKRKFQTKLPNMKEEEDDSLLIKAKIEMLNVVQDKKCAEQVAVLFDTKLAEAIQARESEYVNTMTEVFKDELKKSKLDAVSQKKKNKELEITLIESEKIRQHMQSKIDRRQAENDQQRKRYYKEILALREIVTKFRTDPKTLKAIDDFIDLEGLQDSQRNTLMEIQHVAEMHHKWTPKNTTQSEQAEDTAVNKKMAERIESMKKDLETRKVAVVSMRNERGKWKEKALDAQNLAKSLQEELDTVKAREAALIEANLQASSWWKQGVEGGKQELATMHAAIDTNTITWPEICDAAIQLLNNTKLWQLIETTYHRERIDKANDLNEDIDDLELTEENTIYSTEHWNPFLKLLDKFQRACHTKQKEKILSSNSAMKSCDHCNGTGISNSNVNVSRTSEAYLKKTLAKVLELKHELQLSKQQHLQEINMHAKTKSHMKILQKEIDVVFTKETLDMECQTSVIGEEFENILDEYEKAKLEIEKLKSSEIVLKQKFSDTQELLIASQDNVDAQSEAMLVMKKTMLQHGENLKGMQEASEARERLLQNDIDQLRDEIDEIQQTKLKCIEERQKQVAGKIKKLFLKAPSVSNIIAEDAQIISDDESEIDSEEEDISDNVINLKSNAELHATQAENAKRELDEAMALYKEQNSKSASPAEKSKLSIAELLDANAKLSQDLLQERSRLTNELSDLASELACAQQKGESEVHFWKTECEKLEYEASCLQQQHKRASKQLSMNDQAIKSANILSKFTESCKETSSILSVVVERAQTPKVETIDVEKYRNPDSITQAMDSMLNLANECTSAEDVLSCMQELCAYSMHQVSEMEDMYTTKLRTLKSPSKRVMHTKSKSKKKMHSPRNVSTRDVFHHAEPSMPSDEIILSRLESPKELYRVKIRSDLQEQANSEIRTESSDLLPKSPKVEKATPCVMEKPNSASMEETRNEIPDFVFNEVIEQEHSVNIRSPESAIVDIHEEDAIVETMPMEENQEDQPETEVVNTVVATISNDLAIDCFPGQNIEAFDTDSVEYNCTTEPYQVSNLEPEVCDNHVNLSQLVELYRHKLPMDRDITAMRWLLLFRGLSMIMNRLRNKAIQATTSELEPMELPFEWVALSRQMDSIVATTEREFTQLRLFLQAKKVENTKIVHHILYETLQLVAPMLDQADEQYPMEALLLNTKRELQVYRPNILNLGTLPPSQTIPTLTFHPQNSLISPRVEGSNPLPNRNLKFTNTFQHVLHPAGLLPPATKPTKYEIRGKNLLPIQKSQTLSPAEPTSTLPITSPIPYINQHRQPNRPSPSTKTILRKPHRKLLDNLNHLEQNAK